MTMQHIYVYMSFLLLRNWICFVSLLLTLVGTVENVGGQHS